MDFKKKFKKVYIENIRRQGSTELLSWLETTDFFVAPASTRFHCAYKCGLVEHSLGVYEVLFERHFKESEDNPESFAICGLLHDICKTEFYKATTRNVKNEKTGCWEKQPYFTIEDSFPYGHGEKSVFMIERFMRLKTEEAVAIRWHMAGFDDSAKAGNFAISIAYDKYPLAVKLALSDFESSYLKERVKETN
ncbi:MAG: HD domain-containing protein [Oscillospiraceae bacterium]|jgi:hypothetical protein|nr:HD domain-containing protein [Oscillospiraceae bacterium]